MWLASAVVPSCTASMVKSLKLGVEDDDEAGPASGPPIQAHAQPTTILHSIEQGCGQRVVLEWQCRL